MLSIKKVLPKETPLMFLWMVKDSEKLENNNPIPNHEKLPYIDRLYKWADDQPKRTIKLYYVPFDSNGIDLSKEQIQKFYDLASPEKGGRKNIEVIDLYNSFKDKYDLSFLKDKDTHFACKVDIARIIALIEDGPAIYFDFDVTPREGSKLGKVPMNKHGFAMAPPTVHRAELENSVIAVDSKDNYILRALYDTIKVTGLSETNYDLIWQRQLHAIRQVHAAEQKGVTLTESQLKYLLKDYLLSGEQVLQDIDRAMYETYDNNRMEELNRVRKSYSDKYYDMTEITDTNSRLLSNFSFKGPVRIGKDNSWNFDNISSMEAMHAKQEKNYQEKGFDMPPIKDIEKPYTKLNSFTSLAEKVARKIIGKPSRN